MTLLDDMGLGCAQLQYVHVGEHPDVQGIVIRCTPRGREANTRYEYKLLVVRHNCCGDLPILLLQWSDS